MTPEEKMAFELFGSACPHQEDQTGGQQIANTCHKCVTACISAAVAEAVAAEREANRQAMCEECRTLGPPVYKPYRNLDPSWVHHDKYGNVRMCRADRIRGPEVSLPAGNIPIYVSRILPCGTQIPKNEGKGK